ICLVARQPVDSVVPPRGPVARQGVALLARHREEVRGHGRLVRGDGARVQRRREIPAFRVQARLQPPAERHRVRPRLQEPRARLPRRAFEGNRLALQAGERRGRDRARAQTRGKGRRRQGSKEGRRAQGARRHGGRRRDQGAADRVAREAGDLYLDPRRRRQGLLSARGRRRPCRRGPTPPPREKTLLVYNLKDRKETELGEVTAYEITADGKKMLVKVDKEYALIDLPGAKFEVKDKLSLDGLELRIDRHAEWGQIYNECWRQMRDFFFSPTMNGVDWPAMRAKYAPLVPCAQTRYDLTYLVGELIGEAHNSHTYLGDGDRPLAPRIVTGLLGAELSRDPASRAYRIDRIIHGENWRDSTRSPLTEIGINVAEGDYILAVDGTSVRDLSNIYSALVGRAGKQVVLKVNSRPVEDGARSVTVVPVADEAPLYYESWVRRNADRVSQMTNGRVGYIHIPDMSVEGLGEFAKHFYPQLTKKALIIDERSNGGGNVSPMIIERLARELVLVEKARNGTPRTNPGEMVLGPKVVLMDEFSASDGDLFAYRFKMAGLGKLIGKRSWGGGVGFREGLPIVDGGYLYKPEFAPYSKEG